MVDPFLCGCRAGAPPRGWNRRSVRHHPNNPGRSLTIKNWILKAKPRSWMQTPCRRLSKHKPRSERSSFAQSARSNAALILMRVNRVAQKLKAIDLIQVLSDLFILCGLPGHIRSDNGRSSSRGRCRTGSRPSVPTPPTSPRVARRTTALPSPSRRPASGRTPRLGSGAASPRSISPVQGICLCPVLDYPGWDNDRPCAVGLFSLPDQDGRRFTDPEFSRELTTQHDPGLGRARRGR